MTTSNRISVSVFDPNFTSAVDHYPINGNELVSLAFDGKLTFLTFDVDQLLDTLLAAVNAVQAIIEAREQNRPVELPDRQDIYEEINTRIRGFYDLGGAK